MNKKLYSKPEQEVIEIRMGQAVLQAISSVGTTIDPLDDGGYLNEGW